MPAEVPPQASPGAAPEPAPELPRPVAVGDLDRAPRRVAIAATAEERAALARRLDLEAVEALSAALTLRRVAGPGVARVRVEGSLDAAVVQRCVVSMEPVPATCAARFVALFAPRALVEATPEDPAGHDLGVLGADDDTDPVEPYDGDVIDLGELVAQHLSLALDPFPRAPGAALAAALAAAGVSDVTVSSDDGSGIAPGEGAREPARASPFQALSTLQGSGARAGGKRESENRRGKKRGGPA